MKELLSWAITVGLWATSVVSDGNAARFGWMALDILAFPVGIVRGFLLIVGLAG